MIQTGIQLAETAVGTYGAAAIFGLLVLEGILVGKLLPTRTAFFGAIVLLSGTLTGVISVVAAAVIGATAGQLLLFLAIRYRDIDVESLAARSRLNSRWLDRADSWFDRWGLSALLVSNTVPGIRGYLVIPVALSAASSYRFSIVSLAGTVVYISVLSMVAVGIGTTLFS